MAQYPALPIWTDAYLADTIDLTPEQHGIYLKLLIVAWRTPSCTLLNDPVFLCRVGMTGVDADFDKVKTILVRFWNLEDGHWHQKKLEEVRGKVIHKTKVLHRNASRGGKAKALKDKEAGLADAIANGCLTKTKTKSLNPPTKGKSTSSARAHEADDAGGGYKKCGYKEEWCERIARKTNLSIAEVCDRLNECDSMAPGGDAYDVIWALMDDPSVKDIFAVAKYRLRC